MTMPPTAENRLPGEFSVVDDHKPLVQFAAGASAEP